MDRLFIIGFDANGHYDERDVIKLNDYLAGDSNREITEFRIMPNGEVFIIATD